MLNINKEDNITISIESFDRLMTNCCNQNNCLEEPEKCICCNECDINLKELLEQSR